jgi:cytidine diphosphoramidate kinase
MTINQSKQAGVIWITGLSGAGKTTIAAIVVEELRSEGLLVVLLDGDQMREVFNSTASSSANHSREARTSLAFQYARLCNLIASQGVIVVIATISLFKEVHEWNRKNTPTYFEAYLKVPIAELRKRDPKEIYSKFDAGLLTDIAGLDVKIDEPENPDWQYDFEPFNTAESIAIDLIEAWKARQ